MLHVSEYPECNKVFFFFEEISKIPHGSGNTKKIADYLVEFAKERNLFVYRDQADNVLIRKKASRGYESRPTVILQGHIDMVAQKKSGAAIDMENDGLSIYRDGDFLRAKDTTLGGDDGIAVAYALALLDDPDAVHPELEALFTADEEIGLIGAGAFDTSLLHGKTMINIDSDEEGTFTVGCAGGVRADILLPNEREKGTGETYKLRIFGLLGGHSGAEIHKNRTNANRFGAEMLGNVKELRLIGAEGGSADNVIPREFTATFQAGDSGITILKENLRAEINKIKEREPDADYTLEKADDSRNPLTAESTKNLLSLIAEEPCGVQAMCKDMPELVETSLNLGILEAKENQVHITFSLRSAKSAEKAKLLQNITQIAEKYGASLSTRGDYPAWEYRKGSNLRDVACKVFREQYGKDAKVMIIHAGLECGIFSDRIRDLDCISLGPDNFDIHTTEEHLSISSSVRVFTFLKRVLTEI